MGAYQAYERQLTQQGKTAYNNVDVKYARMLKYGQMWSDRTHSTVALDYSRSRYELGNKCVIMTHCRIEIICID